ncbi:DNA-binding helix-turn-helix protein [Leptotrichia wadei]|jgi:toxin-antitoxin system, antitoxin component, xre family|uniref:DNA-binding helix-turn-helix protein n=1 Tax=Leptotrichia wadei TaxID=157687 RepID=A0A7U6LAF6_9FUSO|nr:MULTISPECIES: helix-turn-helix transcriptional regulator [Leptotrichia]ERK49726.1 DNA-binding helix-turn-helix protein [Leptotrichia sp. oral taxon 879 str. F0557]BBM42611.1 DNA-binding helix-turn-helix protein [Leptotrichia wadei]
MKIKNVTSLGKRLRKIRIDNDEITLNMAEKLGISISYLSAIEHGKRNIPNDFIQKLFDKYQLSEEMKTLIQKDVVDYSGEMKLIMSQMNEQQQELSLLYARKINKLNDKQIKKMRRFLNGEE